MPLELEKAKLMYKLAVAKRNWEGRYDRLEHFKRFPNLKEIIKELSKKRWIFLNNKPKFIGISLNPKFKKEIIAFIEQEMPEVKGIIQ